MKKIVIRLCAVLVVFLVVAAVALVTLFRIENVEVEGNTRVSDEVIKEEIRLDKAHGNTVLLWFLNRNNRPSSNELISSINLQFDFPSNVYVKVMEQVMVGCIEFEGSFVHFNGRGTVISQQSKAQEGIPVVKGAVVTHAQIGKRIGSSEDDAMNDLIEVASTLNNYGITVDSIERNDSGSITAYKGNLVIQLGRNNFMDEKVSELFNIMDKIEKLEGTLHLENYDATKDTIVFSAKDGTKEKKKIKSRDELQEEEEETETETETSVETTGEGYVDNNYSGDYSGNYNDGSGYEGGNTYSDYDGGDSYSDNNGGDYSGENYSNDDYSGDNSGEYSGDYSEDYSGNYNSYNNDEDDEN